MYPGLHAIARPDQPAIVMARSGETVTYRELEARSNRLAHLLRSVGLNRGDHYALFMENHPRYIECDAAGERSGLYFTNVNSFLTAGELAYILNNSLSKVLIASESRRAVALGALRDCPNVELCLIVDGPGEGDRVKNFEEATAKFPSTPIADESRGAAMLYSSGTTGKPKGVLRPMPDEPPSRPGPNLLTFASFWRFREGMIYLMPAPLYHSAPLVGASGTIRLGGTLIVMEHFDAEDYLAPRRKASRHPFPARADDVLAHAEAAGKHPPQVRSVFARGGRPWGGALSGPGQESDDRLVGAHHP